MLASRMHDADECISSAIKARGIRSPATATALLDEILRSLLLLLRWIGVASSSSSSSSTKASRGTHP